MCWPGWCNLQLLVIITEYWEEDLLENTVNTPRQTSTLSVYTQRRITTTITQPPPSHKVTPSLLQYIKTSLPASPSGTTRSQQESPLYHHPSHHTHLLNPLLPLLRIDVPRRAQPALVSRHKRPENTVLAHAADGLVVAFGGPGAGTEFGPVDLLGSMSVYLS